MTGHFTTPSMKICHPLAVLTRYTQTNTDSLHLSYFHGLDDLPDLVITVSKSELEDYNAVAERIGLYVASCIRERSRLIAKG